MSLTENVSLLIILCDFRLFTAQFRVRVRVTLLLAVYRQSALAIIPLRLTTSNVISQLNTYYYSPYVVSFFLSFFLWGETKSTLYSSH
jgi:hypothetical protein